MKQRSRRATSGGTGSLACTFLNPSEHCSDPPAGRSPGLEMRPRWGATTNQTNSGRWFVNSKAHYLDGSAGRCRCTYPQHSAPGGRSGFSLVGNQDSRGGAVNPRGWGRSRRKDRLVYGDRQVVRPATKGWPRPIRSSPTSRRRSTRSCGLCFHRLRSPGHPLPRSFTRWRSIRRPPGARCRGSRGRSRDARHADSFPHRRAGRRPARPWRSGRRFAT